MEMRRAFGPRGSARCISPARRWPRIGDDVPVWGGPDGADPPASDPWFDPIMEESVDSYSARIPLCRVRLGPLDQWPHVVDIRWACDVALGTCNPRDYSDHPHGNYWHRSWLLENTPEAMARCYLVGAGSSVAGCGSSQALYHRWRGHHHR